MPIAADPAWIRTLQGRFIVFDGPDGSGKSTQFARFGEWCRERGVEVVEVREPGGTSIGEQIRQVLLDARNAEMDLRAEMLLYMASRAQLVNQRIRPALAAGQLVLADRFISSTLAYQGSAGGVSLEEILAVGRVAVGECWPSLTVIFDVDEKTASRRLVGSPKSGRRAADPAPQLGLFADRMEQRDVEYRRRVRQGYLDQAAAHPAAYLVIDASPEPDAVFQQLLKLLERALGGSAVMAGEGR